MIACIVKHRVQIAALLVFASAFVASGKSGPKGQRAPQETQARGFWTDPSTGLMWTARDNGKDVTWHKAMNYCRDLRLAGYSDWRLANIGELQAIFDKSANAPGLAGPSDNRRAFTWHVKGALFLTGDQWSSTRRYDDRGHPASYAFRFDFNEGQQFDGDELSFSTNKRALCVRDAKRWSYMNALIENKFAPITFAFGFVESPFQRFSEAFTSWRADIDRKFGTHTDTQRLVDAPLADALKTLEPLTDPLDRYLLLETRSNWTSIFANGLRVSDVASPVGYLSTVLRCRGLTVSAVPDRSEHAGKSAIRIYGDTTFTLYGPEKTDWLNRIRRVSVTNDVSGWEFVARGQVQPYEQTDNYTKRSVAERFTVGMLESYCRALGIETFDEAFYGGRGLAIKVQRKLARPDVRMSIAEARSHLLIP
jgi:hypothetical protein